MKKPRGRCVYLLLLWKSDERDPLSANSGLSNEMGVYACIWLNSDQGERPDREARTKSPCKTSRKKQRER